MDKREFLKTTGALVAGSVLSRVAVGELAAQDGGVQQAAGQRTNWSGNLTYSTDRLHVPATPDEVRQVVKSCEKLRALGSRHSFNSIADSTADQVSLERLKGMALDAKARTVTVDGGVTYSQLAPWLDASGYALHNLASLPHITVAGACRHGHARLRHSQREPGYGGRGDRVCERRRRVHAARAREGRRQVPGRGGGAGRGGGGDADDARRAACVQGGAIGVSRSSASTSWDRTSTTIFASGYSVSVFTDWQKHRGTQLWIKKRLGAGYAGDSIEWPRVLRGHAGQGEAASHRGPSGRELHGSTGDSGPVV